VGKIIIFYQTILTQTTFKILLQFRQGFYLHLNRETPAFANIRAARKRLAARFAN
jgi:hypothetical protein